MTALRQPTALVNKTFALWCDGTDPMICAPDVNHGVVAYAGILDQSSDFVARDCARGSLDGRKGIPPSKERFWTGMLINAIAILCLQGIDLGGGCHQDQQAQ